MRALGVVVIAAMLVVAGCSGDDDSSSSTSTARTTSSTTTRSTTRTTASRVTTTTAAATSTTTAACNPGSPPAAQSSPMPSDVMLLTAVQVTTKRCLDTIAFDFTSSAPQAPGYRVSYEPGPFTQDASGKPITVKGSAFLVVRLEPATGFDFNNNRETYTGPDRIPVTKSAWVTDLVRTGDFESVTTWVVGLRAKVHFTATGAGAPNHRLTVTLG